MKEIKLTQGKVALVDDEDYDWLRQWKWQAHKSRYNYYVDVSVYDSEGKQSTLKMASLIMPPQEGYVVDHIDGDTLNNQKSNLRICTPSQNCANRKRKGIRKYTSRFKGVFYHKWHKRWVAMVCKNHIKVYYKYFKTELDAAKAYDKAAKMIHGEFANLNFK